MEPVAAPVLAAFAAILAVAALSARRDEDLGRRLGSAAPRAHRAPGSHRFLGRVGRSAVGERFPGRERLAEELARSGLAATVDELMGAKVLSVLAAGVFALVSPPPAPWLAPILLLAGFRVPDFVVASHAGRRRALADRELPQLLDLTAAASSAGLSGQLALRRAVWAIRGPLAEELDASLRAVDLGARWQEELRALAERLALPDLRRAVAALTRSGSLGTSLAESMTLLAAEVREERRAALSERARKAPVKMLFPLVFLVLPAFLLLTVVPVLLTTLQSIR